MKLRTIIAAGLLAAACLPLHAPSAKAAPVVDPAKEKSIRRLLELTGTAKLALQSMDQMISSFKQTMPNVPETFWANFRKKARPETLISKVVPIYDKYYTKAEVDGLIAFYQTPLGQKVVQTTPAVSRDSMTMGQAWGRELAAQVMSDLQKEGQVKKRQ